jgi:hypothetical protein
VTPSLNKAGTNKTIKLKPVPGTTLAESKDEARKIREEVLLPALAAGQSVNLDFAEIEFATQSFVHALISEAIRRYGEEAFNMLSFSNCTDEVRQVVLTVFEYTLDAAEAAGASIADGEDDVP